MSPVLDSDLLRTFVAVADRLNFTRAGDALGRTQSAVSIQIKKLEDQLGVALFARGSRGVTLTAAGNRLLDKARRIVCLIDEATEAIRLPVLDGCIRVGICEEYINSLLPKALGAFAAIHPDVEVTVIEGNSMATVAALDAGHLDLAVVFEPADQTRHEILATDPTVWVTCDRHHVHEREPVPIATYSFQAGGWCDDLAATVLRRRGIASRIAYVSRTGSGLAAAVVSGLAIAAMSRSAIPHGCRELTEEEGFGVIDRSNVVLRRRTSGAIVDSMSAALREAFRD